MLKTIIVTSAPNVNRRCRRLQASRRKASRQAKRRRYSQPSSNPFLAFAERCDRERRAELFAYVNRVIASRIAAVKAAKAAAKAAINSHQSPPLRRPRTFVHRAVSQASGEDEHAQR